MAKLFSVGSYATGMDKFPKLRSKRNPNGTVYVQVLCMTADIYSRPYRGKFSSTSAYPDEEALRKKGMSKNPAAVIDRA